MSELKVIDVYGAGEDVVIARDEEDARAIMPDADFDGAVFRVYPDDAPFTICEEEGDPPVTKTCAEWAAKFGRGYFSTTYQ